MSLIKKFFLGITIVKKNLPAKRDVSETEKRFWPAGSLLTSGVHTAAGGQTKDLSFVALPPCHHCLRRCQRAAACVLPPSGWPTQLRVARQGRRKLPAQRMSPFPSTSWASASPDPYLWSQNPCRPDPCPCSLNPSR